MRQAILATLMAAVALSTVGCDSTPPTSSPTAGAPAPPGAPTEGPEAGKTPK
jgi:hypothetical protein